MSKKHKTIEPEYKQLSQDAVEEGHHDTKPSKEQKEGDVTEIEVDLHRERDHSKQAGAYINSASNTPIFTAYAFTFRVSFEQ